MEWARPGDVDYVAAQTHRETLDETKRKAQIICSWQRFMAAQNEWKRAKNWDTRHSISPSWILQTYGPPLPDECIHP